MPRLVERGGGAFVGVSARAALQPFAGAAGYIAGKAAVLAFVQALDAEYSDGRRALQRDPPERDRHARQPRRPARRRLLEVGRPGARSRKVVRFLVSDESAPVSGAAVPVYGRA